MADVRALISELARIDDGPPVVTLYLDTRWRDEHQRERVRLFFRDRAREAQKLFRGETQDGRDINRSLERVGTWVDRLVNQDVHIDASGVMIVACEQRDLFEVVPVSVHLPNAMYVDRQPRLFPLLEALSGSQALLIVSIDSSGAEVLEFREGAVVDEASVERPVPNRHSRGGWAQRKVAQHLRWHIKVVWKECAALVERLAGDEPDAYVVLFGLEENVRNFEKQLPVWVRQRIIGMRPSPPPRDRNRLVNEARALLDEERVARDFAAVDTVVTQALAGRSAALGLAETLDALNERRVRTLLLSRDFDVQGFRCENCDALWHAGAQGCVFCGGHTRHVPLREEIARRCVGQDCELLVVKEKSALDAHRGIGCLLRRLFAEEHQPLNVGGRHAGQGLPPEAAQQPPV